MSKNHKEGKSNPADKGKISEEALEKIRRDLYTCVVELSVEGDSEEENENLLVNVLAAWRPQGIETEELAEALWEKVLTMHEDLGDGRLRMNDLHFDFAKQNYELITAQFEIEAKLREVENAHSRVKMPSFEERKNTFNGVKMPSCDERGVGASNGPTAANNNFYSSVDGRSAGEGNGGGGGHMLVVQHHTSNHVNSLMKTLTLKSIEDLQNDIDYCQKTNLPLELSCRFTTLRICLQMMD